MSTSLLYHGFSIRGYEYVRTEYQEGEVVFTIQQEFKRCRCQACGSRDVRRKGDSHVGVGWTGVDQAECVRSSSRLR